MPHRPEDVVEDEVADLVAERLPSILVIAEVLARVDTARRRLIRGWEKLWKLRTMLGRLGFVREKSRRSVPKKSRRMAAADWLISAWAPA